MHSILKIPATLNMLMQRLSEKLPWWGWVILTLLPPLFYCVSLLSVSPYPYEYDGNVFYPLLLERSGLPFLALLAALVMIAAYGLFHALKAERHHFSIVVWLGVQIAGLWLCVSGFWASEWLLGQKLSHVTSTQFNENVYHLALSYSPGTLGWDNSNAVYIVYRCDNLGWVCKRYSCPFYKIIWYKEDIPPAGFSTDKNELYVQIGSKTSKVLYQGTCERSDTE